MDHAGRKVIVCMAGEQHLAIFKPSPVTNMGQVYWAVTRWLTEFNLTPANGLALSKQDWEHDVPLVNTYTLPELFAALSQLQAAKSTAGQRFSIVEKK